LIVFKESLLQKKKIPVQAKDLDRGKGAKRKAFDSKNQGLPERKTNPSWEFHSCEFHWFAIPLRLASSLTLTPE
jgi:hypothetical protein